MSKKKLPITIISVVLYILAGLILIYAVWSLIHCSEYIGELVSAGQFTIAGSEYELVNFYMGNCAQYFVFAVLLTAAGIIIFRQHGVTARDIPSDTEQNDAESESGNEPDVCPAETDEIE